MYKEAFLRICSAYVKQYRDHAFLFVFDWEKQKIIWDSNYIIKVNITDAEKVFEDIFRRWSLWLWESYCKWNIEADDDEYREFVFIFVRITYNKKLLWKLSLVDIARVLWAIRKKGYFSYGSQDKDINSHYSLSNWFDSNKDSNEFYLSWLNAKYIQYSCWKWDRWTQEVEEAQENKLNFYAKRLWIFKREEWKTLLDLGCWWWWLMFYMAENYGIKCKWLTLSLAQFEYVTAEIKRRWLQDLVSVEVRNIHNMQWKYDYIVSVWVMEHVKDYNDLYKKISKSLNKDWKTLIHSMFQESNKLTLADPFLLKYIFPGGWIPQLKHNLKIFRKYFEYADPNELPDKSYPKTLECWYGTFCRKEKEIRKLLKEKSKVKDIDYAIRVYKHYLVSCYCWLYENWLVCNILAYN
ncbi:MAG: hypothetical protein ACD_2C00263G0003 [uncultured bacterium (gcode 4)]|uniref:Uncharacterized protein n=1 Tax=uncultured bacterium (gcode 4) TaxID=1234023 RepID=K2G3N2_9BACT|nr:MAG: hypothetical protein ACD_2C00263G0003 [uncultured bacterium (gcode 4)]